MEIWGGIECSINRVRDQYFNQLIYQGHYNRPKDLESILELGIKKIRYPVLWERHQPTAAAIDWGCTEKNLLFLNENNIEVIAGLVHHGSGPSFVRLDDPSFEKGLAAYAEKVAQKFPWINFFTPINEPLTTARFSGLYGLWHPHFSDERSFLRILVNECKATIMAMQAIRKINPTAKMLHTEDLGKVHSTPFLQYQADFENERRWLGMDLICGKVNKNHQMYAHLKANGITEHELAFFNEHVMPPEILGFNYYVTSERYIDEQLTNYPEHLHGGNGNSRYVDVEAVRVDTVKPHGPKALLLEAWARYQLPMAVTEAHLHCGREDQLRWLDNIWKTAKELESEGINICAVTAWSLFGAYGWDKLLTENHGNYESGVFDLTPGEPRPTALAKMVRQLAHEGVYHHPVLNGKGWWEIDNSRIIYPLKRDCGPSPQYKSPPVMILGGTGTLGSAFATICSMRNIKYVAPTKSEANLIFSEQIEAVIQKYRPWAIINAAGYANVDAAELQSEDCFLANATGPRNLAQCCTKYGIKLITFSSDLVFDGKKQTEYLETDIVNPLNVYGMSKAMAENDVLKYSKEALIIRSSTFFGPWNQYNFVFAILRSLQEKQILKVAKDVFISPTYIPDLVNRVVDLMIDDEAGIWHLANRGTLTWYDLAKDVAFRAGYSSNLLLPEKIADLGLHALRPLFSALKSSKSVEMPTLDCALDRFFH